MTPHTTSMSDSRAKFEAFMKERFPGVDLFWDEFVSEYVHADAHVAFVSWQASRTAALEEAAQIAESFCTHERAVNMTAQEIITTSVAESIATAIRIAGEGSKG